MNYTHNISNIKDLLKMWTKEAKENNFILVAYFIANQLELYKDHYKGYIEIFNNLGYLEQVASLNINTMINKTNDILIMGLIGEITLLSTKKDPEAIKEGIKLITKCLKYTDNIKDIKKQYQEYLNFTLFYEKINQLFGINISFAIDNFSNKFKQNIDLLSRQQKHFLTTLKQYGHNIDNFSKYEPRDLLKLKPEETEDYKNLFNEIKQKLRGIQNETIKII